MGFEMTIQPLGLAKRFEEFKIQALNEFRDELRRVADKFDHWIVAQQTNMTKKMMAETEDKIGRATVKHTESNKVPLVEISQRSVGIQQKLNIIVDIAARVSAPSVLAAPWPATQNMNMFGLIKIDQTNPHNNVRQGREAPPPLRHDVRVERHEGAAWIPLRLAWRDCTAGRQAVELGRVTGARPRDKGGTHGV